MKLSRCNFHEWAAWVRKHNDRYKGDDVCRGGLLEVGKQAAQVELEARAGNSPLERTDLGDGVVVVRLRKSAFHKQITKPFEIFLKWFGWHRDQRVKRELLKRKEVAA